MINLILSSIIIYTNYVGIQAVTSYTSYVALILLKIYNSIFISYESLHNDEGNAVTEFNEVLNKIKDFRDWVNIEIDLVREACKEYENDTPF